MANVGGVNIGAGLNGQKKNYHHGNLAEAVLLRAAEIIDERGIEALSLRSIARDLGVSHSAPNRHFRSKASLLSALALDGWLKVRDATLSAAEETGSSNPHIRLNAMGRGYMRWALINRALFRAINHPDVKRYAGDELNDAVDNFSAIVRSAIDATRRAGRHAETSLTVLTIFTNAVPIGAATVLSDSLLAKFMPTDMDEEELIAQVVDLVVPLSGVEIEDGKSLSNSRPPSS